MKSVMEERGKERKGMKMELEEYEINRRKMCSK